MRTMRGVGLRRAARREEIAGAQVNTGHRPGSLATTIHGVLLAGAIGGALFGAPGRADAHHSMAMYEFALTHLEGTVQDFKYVNPHSIILLKVTAPNGTSAVWFLEGDPPATLAREGLSATAFRQGDRMKLDVNRLRSGQDGGYWSSRTIYEINGREFFGSQCARAPDHCGTPQ